MEENEALKVRHQVLENKHDQSQHEAAKEMQLGKEERVKLTHPSAELSEHENTATLCKGNESKLNAIISRQQNEMKEHKVKFAEDDKLTFNALLEIEKTMKSKIDCFGASLKETLLEVVQDNNINLENKLNEVMNAQKTCASAAQGSADGNFVQPNIPVHRAQNNDFRSIVRATKNEELAEERENKLHNAEI